jgi:hypothetical protein
LKLSGKIINQGKTVKAATVVRDDPKVSFHDLLEDSLVRLCKELEIPVPMWLRNNTSEFAAFRKTSFYTEHFMEEMKFDRLEIRLEQS